MVAGELLLWLGRGRGRLGRGGLLGDHVALDLGVGRFGEDLLLDQLVLARVRAVLDDLRGVRVKDAGQRLQLVLRRRVEVERALLRRLGVGLRSGRLGLGLGGLSHDRGDEGAEDEDDGNDQREETSHVCFLPLRSNGPWDRPTPGILAAPRAFGDLCNDHGAASFGQAGGQVLGTGLQARAQRSSDVGSSRRVPRVAVTVRSPAPGLAILRATWVPGGVPPTRRVSSLGLWIGTFWNAVITSPGVRPAAAAGERGTTSATNAPRSPVRPIWRRTSAGTGPTPTPR